MAIGGLPGNPKCKACKSTRLVLSATIGLAKCEECGQLNALSPDLAEHMYGHDDAPEQFDDVISIPDSVECAIGWRVWGVPEDWEEGTVPVLRSVTHTKAFWTPGQPMVGVCDRSVDNPDHRVPMKGCSCGLYTAKTYEHLMGMNYHHSTARRNGLVAVVGKVKLWGKVIEGTQGWKAQYGYPSELFVPFEHWRLIEPLEEAYGVTVLLKNVLGVKLKDENEGSN